MKSLLRVLAPALVAALCAPAHAQLVGGQWETLWQFDGQAVDNFQGTSVSCAGDVDGDGFDDLIVGASGADPGGVANAGSAYVFSGATGTLIWQFDGQFYIDLLGYSASGAGDVDGDGFDDLIVGAFRADPGGLSDAGSAYVYSGATGTLIWQFDGQADGDELGRCVSGAGDVNGDGFDDLIVGARNADPGGVGHAGSAYVYSGATGTLLWQFDGQAANEQLGESVSGAGDVDGDGFDDLIVGAPQGNPGGLTKAGFAYVYSGATGTLIWQFNGQVAYDYQGISVSGAGDVNGDGFDDLIVGADQADPGGPTIGPNAGSAYVFSGATGTLIWQFDGQASHDYLGSTVSNAGDVDGDGLDDLIVGAWGAEPGGLYRAGSAYVYSGATGTLIRQFNGQASDDYLGSAVSDAGDVDGDGLDDLIVGAYSASPGGLNDAGSAYVYSLDAFLHMDSTEISYSGNQPVQFDLDFPASEAGAHYAILLSISGTAPSYFNGLLIPLVQDAHFQQFLGNSTLHGTLNANAQAQKMLRLHRQTPPGAIGVTIYLAAATFATGLQQWRRSSVVRYLQIAP